MAWTNLSAYVGRVRHALTPAQDGGLPQNVAAIDEGANILRDLLGKVRGSAWDDVDQFFSAYGNQSQVTDSSVRSGALTFLDNLAACLYRMQMAGRFRGSSHSDPGSRYYEYLIGELRLVAHYSWATRGGLMGRYRSQSTRLATGDRIGRLEANWCEHWRLYFLNHDADLGPAFNAMGRYVIANWDLFSGRRPPGEGEENLAEHASELDWEVRRERGTAWYESLDVVDGSLPPSSRNQAEREAMGMRSDSSPGFWQGLYNGQRAAFNELCQQAGVCQQNFLWSAPGTRITDELHQRDVARTTQGAKDFLEANLPHWEALSGSLAQADADRIEALRECYDRFWSQDSAVMDTALRNRAGITVQASGGYNAAPPGTTTDEGCGCNAAGQRQTSPLVGLVQLLLGL